MALRLSARCHEPWESMRPTVDGAHCARCDREVLDLRDLTLEEAEALVASRRNGDHRPCIRMRGDRDGQPVFVPERALSRWKRIAGGAAIAASLAACGPSAAEPAPSEPAPVAAPPPTAPSAAPAPIAPAPIEPAPAAAVEPPVAEPPPVEPAPVEHPHHRARHHDGQGPRHDPADDLMGLDGL